MDVHEDFRSWTEARGIEIHPSIRAQRLPGRGIGIVATKAIAANTEILGLPATTLTTIDSQFVLDERIPSDLTVHCTLASAWALNSVAKDKRQFQQWEATWPSWKDIETSVPLFWDSELRAHLPPAAQNHLKGVQRKYDKDWNAVEQVIGAADISQQTFMYYWMLVNSRCYFWNYAKSRKRKPGDNSPRSVDECMALCPFADYFNHDSHGVCWPHASAVTKDADQGKCTFSSDKSGCVVTTNKAYDADEEITLPYGTHNNDFLLVEYGFLLDNNEHDCIQLDSLILPKLTAKSKRLLEELNYLGEYNLYKDDTCFRTKVALAAMFLKPAQLMQYTETENLTTGQRKQLADQQTVLLRELQGLINRKLIELSNIKERFKTQMLSIKHRWQEMQSAVKVTGAWRALD